MLRRLDRLVPRGGLWRHGDFLRLWSAETVSQVGTQVTLLALPLAAILVLDASAFAVAALSAVEFAPFLLFALPAGVWVDRWPRRPILIVSDLGRAAALVSVPVAYALDVLTLWQLFAVAFVTGGLTVFFDVAYQSYLPSLVERDQLVEGNSKLELSRSTAMLAGPGIAGTLVEIVTAPVAILADAISFAASGLFVLRIRKRETPPRDLRSRDRPRMRAELGEGLRYGLRHRSLRWIAASTATWIFFSNVMWAILLVYVVRELDLRPSVIGLIFAIANVGALAGVVLAPRLARWVGAGPVIVLGAATGIASLLIPLAPRESPVPFLVASELVISLGVTIYNITQVSFRQAITPERLQGRMNSVIRFIAWGVMPLGSLIGGVLASAVDLRFAIWVGALGMSFAFLPVLLSPVRSLREVPASGEPADGSVAVAAMSAPEPHA